MSIPLCFMLSLMLGCLADSVEYKKLLRDEIPDIFIYSHMSERLPETNFGICQISADIRRNPEDGLIYLRNERQTSESLRKCLQKSIESGVNVLMFPEHSMSFRNETLFDEIQALFQTSANFHNMIILGGTYYDSDRYSRFPVFGGGWTLTGYKFGSNYYEAEIYKKTGARPGKNLSILETDYGRFLIVIGVDILNDSVQYSARRLAAGGAIDGVIVLANSANSLELLSECNRLVRHRSMFVLFVNAVSSQYGF